MPLRALCIAALLLPVVGCNSKVEETRRAQAAVEVSLLSSVVETSFVIKAACPASFEQLKADGALSPTSNTTDPWGTPYTLRCDPDVKVTSFGADKKEGTADDIVTTKKKASTKAP